MSLLQVKKMGNGKILRKILLDILLKMFALDALLVEYIDIS